MKITAVNARALSIPRAARLTTSYGSWDGAVTVLVELRTDAGCFGVGQASVDVPFYGESAEGMLANIRSYLAPALMGENPLDINRLNAKLHAALPHHWFSCSAVEMALWDLKGKVLGVPLYELLGGKVRDGVTLMGSLVLDTPEAMAANALEQLDMHDHGVLKMKVGFSPRDDVARYRAVVDAVGDRAGMIVDGNTGYTIADALLALAGFERAGGLLAVEQPVARMDDLAEVARRSSVPIIADESIYGPSDAIEVVRRRAASLAFIKLSKHGGIENVRSIAAIFDAAGLSLAVGIYYDLLAVAASHLAAALPAVRWPSALTEMQDTIIATPFGRMGSLVPAPDGPGLGVELDWEKVDRYTLRL